MAKDRVKEQIIINKNLRRLNNRIIIGTPTLGLVRFEWAQARYGQIMPCNWSAGNAAVGFSHFAPLNYLVDDAQNIIVQRAVNDNYEWMLFVEDDVILPVDAFIRFNEYMKSAKYPVVSGLYFLKSEPTEPLVYRGRGNSCFANFKVGDLVWADGVPTGCLLVHGSVLKLMWDESEEYQTASGHVTRRVFETPRISYYDPEIMTYQQAVGTSDLYWCDRVIKDKVLKRAGWKGIGRRKYPFLVDTNIACDHIDLNSGYRYPKGGFKNNGGKPFF